MEENTTTTQQLTLDGKIVTIQELNEAKNKQGTRITETAPGVYKTLQRLNG